MVKVVLQPELPGRGGQGPHLNKYRQRWAGIPPEQIYREYGGQRSLLNRHREYSGQGPHLSRCKEYGGQGSHLNTIGRDGQGPHLSRCKGVMMGLQGPHIGSMVGKRNRGGQWLFSLFRGEINKKNTKLHESFNAETLKIRYF